MFHLTRKKTEKSLRPLELRSLRWYDSSLSKILLEEKSLSILTENGESTTPMYKGIDQTGIVYGRWTVLSREGTRDFPNGHSTPLWRVRCECGNIEIRQPQSVRDNGKTGCPECLKGIFSGSKSWHWKGGRHVSGYFLAKIRAGAAKRARDLECSLTIEYLDALWELQEGRCIYSGLELVVDDTASLDRIDSALGYVEGNVQFVHKDVNKMKFDLKEERFLHLCRMINNNYDK